MKVARVERHEIDNQVFLAIINTLQIINTTIIMSKELITFLVEKLAEKATSRIFKTLHRSDKN